MVTSLDVANYILNKSGPMSAMKLQKLVYYSQAWSLVWDDTPLFDDRIEAWANGPVVPRLYAAHRMKFHVSETDIPGDAQKLNPDQRDSVDAVIAHYGTKSPQYLSDLTHEEQPWRDARGDLKPGERGSTQITKSSMVEFYGSL